MACNKQTTSAPHADPKASTANPCFRFGDTHPDPKFRRLQFRFYNYIHTSSDTREYPDVLNNASEPGRTETSTNGGRYSILISFISCTLVAVLPIVSLEILGIPVT